MDKKRSRLWTKLRTKNVQHLMDYHQYIKICRMETFQLSVLKGTIKHRERRRTHLMKILQALFFPPEQPGGVSSMVPYIQDKFVKMGWKMDLFSLPKRI